MARLLQGMVCWAELPEPAGRRPVLVLTRSDALPRLSYATVAPLTRTSRAIRSEVQLSPESDGVRSPCAITLDNLLTVPKGLIAGHITTLSRARLEQVFDAVRYVFAMD